ncbi:MAG: hypothetical protein ACLQFR_31905 [Streptosporangiaceae bacterium]
MTRRAKAPSPHTAGDGGTAPELGGEQHQDQVVHDGGAAGTRAAWVGGDVAGIVSTGDNAVNINQVNVLPPDAVSPPRPGDPDRLGLVENPLQVLGLGALATEAKSLEASDPLGSACRYGVLADKLQEANFPGHAAGQRIRQAQLLHAGGDVAAAFGILWSLALEEFASGAVRQPGGVVRGLDALRPGLGDLQAAKLAVLNAAQDWYEQGSLLAVAMPALEAIVVAADPDAAFLVCAALEQAVVDGWFDFDPPYSLVTPDGNTADLLARLRRCADGMTCPDVVIRARLACAIADADLAADSTAAQAEAVYAPILGAAGAGRYLHAGGLVFARAARAFAMHGDTARAIDLWRQSILESSESRRYGDVLACRRALNAAILEQPVPPVPELDFTASLPNDDRLLAAAQPAAEQALRALHAGRLPAAFGVTRRYLWEARLSGQLTDERDALKLFGDIMLAAGRPAVAVTAWLIGGMADKAASVAAHATVLVEANPWARSPTRACQAAAAQVIGAQARLYGPDAAEEPVHLLLGLTGDLWTRRRIAPDPSVDAVKALSRFGVNLPGSAVDPVLGLLQPHLTGGGALTPETVDLLIQLYWAVPGRREDLGEIIGFQLGRGDPPPGLWDMVANLPDQARNPLTAAVHALAAAGGCDALLTLAKWGRPTREVQVAARRTAAYLLRQPADQPSATWSYTTQFADTVDMLLALAGAETLADVNPRDLRPGVGPILTGRSPFPISLTIGQPTPGTAPTPPGHVDDTTGTRDPIHPAGEGARPGPTLTIDPGWEPDEAAIVAAGPLATVAGAVAEHLVIYAQNQHAPGFIRTEAVAALLSLLRLLPPDLNVDLAGRLLAIAENPTLTELDQAEIASQDALSRGRLDTGAKNLPIFALLTAATAAGLAADAEPGIDTLPDQAVQSLFSHAVQLLHSPDPDASRYGAGALAWTSKYAPRLAPFTTALITHPSDEVRNVAAAMAILDEAAQRILAVDPSPQVRASLASRTGELADDVLPTLRADQHPEVRRTLTVAQETGDIKVA